MSKAEIRVVEEVTIQCLHTELESLGSGGNATYRRCLACEGVIVTFAGRLWLLSRPRPG